MCVFLEHSNVLLNENLLVFIHKLPQNRQEKVEKFSKNWMIFKVLSCNSLNKMPIDFSILYGIHGLILFTHTRKVLQFENLSKIYKQWMENFSTTECY